MHEVIVFKNEDGTCGIITPAPKALNIMNITDIAQRDVPVVNEDDVYYQLPWRVTTRDKLPLQFRQYRNAWTDDNLTDTVDVDLAKAKEIHMQIIREKRDQKLKELDIETLKGRDVQAQKQQLRDLPASIFLNKAKTIEELATLIPKELV